MKTTPIKDVVSPIVKRLEIFLLSRVGEKPRFSNNDFRAILYIFLSAMLDKTYDLQKIEKMEEIDQIKMVQKMAKDLRKLVKTYTDIDTFKLFDE